MCSLNSCFWSQFCSSLFIHDALTQLLYSPSDGGSGKLSTVTGANLLALLQDIELIQHNFFQLFVWKGKSLFIQTIQYLMFTVHPRLGRCRPSKAKEEKNTMFHLYKETRLGKFLVLMKRMIQLRILLLSFKENDNDEWRLCQERNWMLKTQIWLECKKASPVTTWQASLALISDYLNHNYKEFLVGFILPKKKMTGILTYLSFAQDYLFKISMNGVYFTAYRPQIEDNFLLLKLVPW